MAAPSTTQTQVLAQSSNNAQTNMAFYVIAGCFFMFGFLTCMNDVLVPHLKSLFTLNYTQAILVQFCFFFAYFVMSIPSAQFCSRFGYKTGMITGLFITSGGTLGLYASAGMLSFNVFLAGFFVLASGITLIQVAANPYVTLLGDPARASSRLTLVQAFNSLGTTIAPMVGSAFILSQTGPESIQGPYLVLTAIIILLALVIIPFKLPHFEMAHETTSYAHVLKNKRVALGALGIFCYVGAEVAIGSFLINWLGDSSVRGFTAEQAGHYVSYYWGGAMIGRFFGTPLLMRFSPPRVLGVFIAAALLGVVATMFSSGETAQWTILAVGLFNSIMFPTIYSLSVDGLKEGTAKASGIICTAIVGGAIIPLIQGILADMVSLRVSFIIPALCYVYLLYMARVFARIRA